MDWTKPNFCIGCSTEVRPSNSKPDGRIAYAANGLCINCYRVPIRRSEGAKARKYVKYTDTHQECSGCLRWLTRGNFAKSFKGGRSGLRSVCTRCVTLKQRYKMSHAQYISTWDEQKGKCLCCEVDASKTHQGLIVDHDHFCCSGIKSCGTCVRGLICSFCNLALGAFKDDMSVLNTAINYLTQPLKIIPPSPPPVSSYNVSGERRFCGKCKLVLDRDKFYVKGSSICKRCTIYKKYSITKEDYYSLLVEQNYKCAICPTEHSEGHRSWLSIDHDHSCCNGPVSCGKCIRGLLCRACNPALGLVQDSVDTLRSLQVYLQRYVGGPQKVSGSPNV